MDFIIEHKTYWRLGSSIFSMCQSYLTSFAQTQRKVCMVADGEQCKRLEALKPFIIWSYCVTLFYKIYINTLITRQCEHTSTIHKHTSMPYTPCDTYTIHIHTPVTHTLFTYTHTIHIHTPVTHTLFTYTPHWHIHTPTYYTVAIYTPL